MPKEVFSLGIPSELPLGRAVSLFLLDLLYPNRCPCCKQSIPWHRYVCDSCAATLALPEHAVCPGCGKAQEDCICDTAPAFDRGLAAVWYEGVGRAGILSLKDAESLHFARYCGTILGKQILADPQLNGYDCVVPVPMATRKKRRRYCNPAEVLAKEIAAVTRIPMRTDLLHCAETAVAQHTLSAAQRRKHVSQFSAAGKDLKGYRILLCDDVLTTGSTMNRCAELLKAQGAVSVAAAAAATTRRNKETADIHNLHTNS